MRMLYLAPLLCLVLVATSACGSSEPDDDDTVAAMRAKGSGTTLDAVRIDVTDSASVCTACDRAWELLELVNSGDAQLAYNRRSEGQRSSWTSYIVSTHGWSTRSSIPPDAGRRSSA